MFEIVVAIWLSNAVITYALPKRYNYAETCEMKVDAFSQAYTAKAPALQVGFKCDRAGRSA